MMASAGAVVWWVLEPAPAVMPPARNLAARASRMFF
jgi:hypothetical protein